MDIQWTDGLVPVKADETCESLIPGGAAILQKRDGFRFGTDAVALARFAVSHLRVRNGRRLTERAVDLGTGTGIIPLLLALDTEIPRIHAVEIQPDMADMARRSVAGNRLEERITVLEADLRQADVLLGRGCHDLVLCNPPYQPLGAAIHSEGKAERASRHEIHCTLADVVLQAARLLRNDGAFCVVHRPERLSELFCLMSAAGIEPKQLQMLHRSAHAPPSLVFVRGVRCGRRGLQILPPLIGPGGGAPQERENRQVGEEQSEREGHKDCMALPGERADRKGATWQDASTCRSTRRRHEA